MPEARLLLLAQALPLPVEQGDREEEAQPVALPLAEPLLLLHLLLLEDTEREED